MLTTNESIGRFLVFANQHKEVITKASIEKKIDDLIYLIKYRSKSNTIDEIAESVLPDVFDLRIEVLGWLSSQDKNVGDYLEGVNEVIAQSLNKEVLSELSITISNVLQGYEKIISQLAQKINLNKFSDAVDPVRQSKQSYDTIKDFSSHPSSQIQYFKKWIDASLKLETGLIISDLVLTHQISFSNRWVRNELIQFLNTTITRFGAYSIYTQIWTPDENDHSHLTNKMEILAATIDFDNNRYLKVQKDSLYSFLTN